MKPIRYLRSKLVTLVRKIPVPASWWLFALLLFGWYFFAGYWSYSSYERELTEQLFRGDFPPEADSIGMPLGNWIVGYIILTILALPYFLWAIWSYSDNFEWAVFSKRKCIRSSFALLITAFWIYVALGTAYDDCIKKDLIHLLMDFLSLYLAVVSNAAIQSSFRKGK